MFAVVLLVVDVVTVSEKGRTKKELHRCGTGAAGFTEPAHAPYTTLPSISQYCTGPTTGDVTLTTNKLNNTERRRRSVGSDELRSHRSSWEQRQHETRESCR